MNAQPNLPRVLSVDDVAAIVGYVKGVRRLPRDPELQDLAIKAKERERRREQELASRPIRFRERTDEERDRDEYRAWPPEDRCERTWMDEENEYLDRMEARGQR